MKKLPKTLEDNESTFHNGGSDSMCGGVISQSRFDECPMGNMMAHVMPDDEFEIYKKLSGDKKHEYFEKHAKSMI